MKGKNVNVASKPQKTNVKISSKKKVEYARKGPKGTTQPLPEAASTPGHVKKVTVAPSSNRTKNKTLSDSAEKKVIQLNFESDKVIKSTSATPPQPYQIKRRSRIPVVCKSTKVNKVKRRSRIPVISKSTKVNKPKLVTHAISSSNNTEGAENSSEKSTQRSLEENSNRRLCSSESTNGFCKFSLRFHFELLSDF